MASEVYRPRQARGDSIREGPIEQVGKAIFYAVLTGLGLGVGFYIVNRIVKKQEK